MNNIAILEFVNLFCAGMLAGAEFVVRYGVVAPVAILEQEPQIRLRQALIRRLRVVVPVLFLSTLVTAVALVVLESARPGSGFRSAGFLAILTWALTTFLGTVPINRSILDWQPDAPPPDWTATIRRWERLDTVRSTLAVVAFACFLTAVALRLAATVNR